MGIIPPISFVFLEPLLCARHVLGTGDSAVNSTEILALKERTALVGARQQPMFKKQVIQC